MPKESIPHHSMRNDGEERSIRGTGSAYEQKGTNSKPFYTVEFIIQFDLVHMKSGENVTVERFARSTVIGVFFGLWRGAVRHLD